MLLDVTGGAGFAADAVIDFFSWAQLANPQQRDILDANYGRKDSACEARCKVVFEELRLRTLYTEYEEDAYVRINMLIEKFPEENYDGPVSGGLFFHVDCLV